MNMVDKIHELRDIQYELQYLRYRGDIQLSKAFKVVLDDMDKIIDTEIEDSLATEANKMETPLGSYDFIGEWLDSLVVHTKE